jgi:hypothetical protein
MANGNRRNEIFPELTKRWYLSPAQIRLLNNTFCGWCSVSALCLCRYSFRHLDLFAGDELGPTITWIIIYLLCAVAIRILHRRYQREAKENDEGRPARWLPRINNIAFIHGLGISSLYLITPQTQNFDFFLLLNISIAAIVAANATHLTPVISTFTRFFFASWGC